MHFGENQLSPSLIGLSPLPTAHPPGFQPWWVRSSTRSYPRFNLAIGRSLGFGSGARDYRAPCSDSLSLRLPPTGQPRHVPPIRRLILQKARNHPRRRNDGRLSRLVGTRFQVLFHSPPGVLFTFPSRYLSAIGHQGVFRLGGWSRRIHTEFHGLGATWEHPRETTRFRVRGSHPLRRPLPEAFH